MDARCNGIECKGKGAVIAILDSGVRATHVEFAGRLRPTYNWFDPYNGTAEPYDSGYRGTHIAGIAVGATIGVAPEAQFIACLAIYGSQRSEKIMKLCMQWALCPWAWNATTDEERAATMNCDMAPHIVSITFSDGPEDVEDYPWYFFQRSIIAFNAAGIMHTLGAGNAGPYCTSISSPGVLDVSFTIGNTDVTRTIEWHSSRGPAYYPLEGEGYEPSCLVDQGSCRDHCGWTVTVQGGKKVCTLTKPNVVAPGTDISSADSDSDTDYFTLSGTSMSTPAVAGVMALMHCANSDVKGSRKLTQNVAVDILQRTASTKGIDLGKGNQSDNYLTNFAELSHEMCDIAFGANSDSFPNNVYGHGIVDACQAVRMTRKKAEHDAIASIFYTSNL